MIYTDNNIREMVKRYMEIYDVSLREFAEQSGVSRTMVRMFLKGETPAGDAIPAFLGRVCRKGYDIRPRTVDTSPGKTYFIG